MSETKKFKVVASASVTIYVKHVIEFDEYELDNGDHKDDEVIGGHLEDVIARRLMSGDYELDPLHDIDIDSVEEVKEATDV